MKRLFVPRSNGNIIAVTEQLDLCHVLFLVIGLTLPVLIQLRFQQVLDTSCEYTNIGILTAGIDFVLYGPGRNTRYPR